MIRGTVLALMLGALVAVPGLAQESDEIARKIEEILPRLSEDAIEVRDQAVKALIELGPAAVPLLRRRAVDLPAETRGRLLEACSRIETRNTLAKYLPPLRKVTLDWENKPAREALDEIGRRIEINVDGSNANADASITFSLKDATPVQAIDEVCRQAGLNWRAVDDDFYNGRRRNAGPRGEPRIIVQNGKIADYPGTYLRHYRFRVTQVSLTRTNNFQNAGQSNAQMNLDLGWAPDVKPDGLQSFKITELKDEQGRSLLPEENDRFRGRMRTMRGRYRGRDMSSYSQYLSFKFPEADAKKIAVLKGTAVFSYPQEIKMISFGKPTDAAGKPPLELNGLTLAIKDYQEKDAGHSLTIEIAGKYQGPGDADAEDDGNFNNLPFSYEDVELVTENGEPLRHQGMSGRGDGKTYSWAMEFSSEKPAPIKEVRIFCVLRRFNDETAFEIRDIPLPK